MPDKRVAQRQLHCQPFVLSQQKVRTCRVARAAMAGSSAKALVTNLQCHQPRWQAQAPGLAGAALSTCRSWVPHGIFLWYPPAEPCRLVLHTSHWATHGQPKAWASRPAVWGSLVPFVTFCLAKPGHDVVCTLSPVSLGSAQGPWEHKLQREARAQGKRELAAHAGGGRPCWELWPLCCVSSFHTLPWPLLSFPASALAAGYSLQDWLLSKSGFFGCLVWLSSFSQGSTVRPGLVSRAVVAFLLCWRWGKSAAWSGLAFNEKKNPFLDELSLWGY